MLQGAAEELRSLNWDKEAEGRKERLGWLNVDRGYKINSGSQVVTQINWRQ